MIEAKQLLYFTPVARMVPWTSYSITSATPPSPRHLLQLCYLSKEFLFRLSRAAEQRCARRHIGYHTCLCPDLSAAPNPDVSSDCGLSANLNEILDHCRPGNTDLRDYDATPADHDVVGNLHEIIQA
jgi:hypothetical protein